MSCLQPTRCASVGLSFKGLQMALQCRPVLRNRDVKGKYMQSSGAEPGNFRVYKA